MPLPFYILDSFTRTAFSGNPAGVFLDADGLSPEQMMRLAGEVSLESAFVSGSGDSLALRYFTPTEEVPLCGHATVAAFTALALDKRVPTGEDIPFTCPAGRLSVRLSPDGGGVIVHLRQAAPVFGARPGADDLYDIAAALGAAPADLHPLLPAEVVSTGSPILFVPVARLRTVDEAPADLDAIAALSRQFDAIGIYVFSLNTRAAFPEPLVHARNFCPAAGLDEDPVTGSASGALGCYLVRHGVLHGEKPTFAAEQGKPPRNGSLTVTVDRDATGEPTGVEIAGIATLIASGTITAPPA